MSRKREKNYRLLTVKAYFDADADILAWWESIDMGERSTALREAIRLYAGQQLRPKRLDIPEMSEIRQDTRWIREALNDMPAYLERVIQQVAAVQPVMVGQTRSPAQAGHNQAALTDAAAERRTQRMRKATW